MAVSHLRALLLHSASFLVLAGTAVAQSAAPAPAPKPTDAKPAAAAAASVTSLDAVTVSATRNATPIGEVPATVTVIDAEELDRIGAKDIHDAVRYEPGVSVGRNAGRAGLTNFSIRGINGNRVRVQVDGSRVPDFPGSNFGAGTYTRDFVDIDSVKQIEIIRGPASALYGSDALGGVVSYVTKDPGDYLDMVGKNWFLGGKAGYDSADNSFSETLTGAARAGQFETLFQYTRRDGEEVDRNGNIKPDPIDYFSNNFLGKLVWHATPSDQFRLTGEHLERTTKTEVLSDRSATVLDSNGEDETKRYRIGLDHVHSAPFSFVDRLEWRLNYTKLERTENTVQQRLTSGTNRVRNTDLEFNQDIVGGDVQLNSSFTLAGLTNKLTYGASLEHIETSRPRDRSEIDLSTGITTKTFSGGPGVPNETFPNKNFPDTKTIQGGAYIQDEIAIGRLTLVPGVRVDYYKLDPKPDADFYNTNTQNFQVRAVDDIAVSPKFGATYKLTDQYLVYGQYAHGFRSPPYDDANIGFTNGPQRYEILPNPNLESEESDGFEVGFRGKYQRSSFSIASYYNTYRNFIESQVIGSRAGITQYQSRNIDHANIWGAEAKGEWWFLSEFALTGALAYSRGENEDTGKPLDSVDPLTAVAGLRYRQAEGPWGAELVGTHVWKKERVSDQTYFKAPSYTTVDLLASYDWSPMFGIRAGLYNLFDEQYYQSQDMIGVAANRTDIERFASPGRTVAVSASIRF